MTPKQRFMEKLRAMGLGTKLEKAIGQIPLITKLPCYDAQGRLKPESGCGKRRAWLDGK